MALESCRSLFSLGTYREKEDSQVTLGQAYKGAVAPSLVSHMQHVTCLRQTSVLCNVSVDSVKAVVIVVWFNLFDKSK